MLSTFQPSPLPVPAPFFPTHCAGAPAGINLSPLVPAVSTCRASRAAVTPHVQRGRQGWMAAATAAFVCRPAPHSRAVVWPSLPESALSLPSERRRRRRRRAGWGVGRASDGSDERSSPGAPLCRAASRSVTSLHGVCQHLPWMASLTASVGLSGPRDGGTTATLPVRPCHVEPSPLSVTRASHAPTPASPRRLPRRLYPGEHGIVREMG